MPALTYTKSAFTPFTKIVSADMNQFFTDIQTLLNTTLLDNTNIQNSGINPLTKLSGTGGTAGQFLGTNATNMVFISNPLSTQFNYILGSAAQVTAGTATNSTFASIVQADGDRILVLPSYVTNEAWAITKKLYIEGLGNTSIILGAITFGTGSSSSWLSGVQVQNTVTINSGITGVYNNIWFSSTNTFTDNNTTPSNTLFALQG